MSMVKVCVVGLALALSGCAVSTGDNASVEDVGTGNDETVSDDQIQQRCGGIAGFSCDTGFYCNYTATSSCGEGDQMGVCEVKPQICPMVVMPVCGCDGNNYPNPCLAESKGVSPAHPGPCH